MSINGVFRTSISGMNAQANRLSVVSENIANANTNGYKRGSTEFSSLILPQGGGDYNSGSVVAQVRQSISQQGSVATTSSASDLAIQGNGFFVVQDAAGREFYTRAGSFVQRTDNLTNTTYLVNAAGFRLTGTSLQTGQTGPIELPVGQIVAPAATTSAGLSVQFPVDAEVIDDPANATLPDDFTKKSSVTVYDNVGRERTLDVYLTKTADNNWKIDIYEGDTAVPGGSTTVEFDPANGLPTAAVAPLALDLGGGQTVALDFGSLTEYDTDFTAKLDANGNPPGAIAAFAFTDDGMLNGIMDSGDLIPLYQLNLASFSSPDQLAAGAGNVYSATTTSGAVQYGGPGSNGFGALATSALEQSNVDMATELTTMIEAQRSYSANSKVFQTGSEILDVLVNLKR